MRILPKNLTHTHRKDITMELVTGTFTVSAAQKAVIDTMRSPHLSLTHFNDETIAVVDVIDDHTIRNYSINPDGTHIIEELEEIGGGWTQVATS